MFECQLTSPSGLEADIGPSLVASSFYSQLSHARGSAEQGGPACVSSTSPGVASQGGSCNTLYTLPGPRHHRGVS